MRDESRRIFLFLLLNVWVGNQKQEKINKQILTPPPSSPTVYPRGSSRSSSSVMNPPNWRSAGGLLGDHWSITRWMTDWLLQRQLADHWMITRWITDRLLQGQLSDHWRIVAFEADWVILDDHWKLINRSLEDLWTTGSLTWESLKELKYCSLSCCSLPEAVWGSCLNN